MQRLLLLMGLHPDDPVAWAMGSDGRVVRSGTAAALSGLSDEAEAAEQVVVILRGDLAATRRLRLPVRREAALEAAARLAFEDILATPAEDMHFAFGVADAQGDRMASAVPAEWFDGWMDALSEAGIRADLVTADHLALPADRRIVVDLGDRTLIRLGEGGMTVEPDFLDILLPALEDAKNAQRVKASNTDELAALYLERLQTLAPPSFLRGRHRLKQDWSGTIRQWRFPAGLAAACLLVWCAGLLVDGMRHAGAARDLNDEAAQMFTEAYPGVRVRDLARQAAARAGESGTPMLLPLSVALTEAMEETEAVELTGLSYQAGEGMVADLRFPDAAVLETLRARLEADGIPTSESGSLRREEDGRFAGQLILRGASS